MVSQGIEVMLFVASSFSVEAIDELNTLVVALAENRDGSGARLEFQKALSFDEADIGAGMDTYCLVLGSGATHYGGIKDWVIQNHRLTVQLDAAAAEELGLSQSFDVICS